MIRERYLRVDRATPEGIGLLENPEADAFFPETFAFSYRLPLFRGWMPTFGARGNVIVGTRPCPELVLLDEGPISTMTHATRTEVEFVKTAVIGSERNFRMSFDHDQAAVSAATTLELARLCVLEALGHYKEYKPHQKYLDAARFLLQNAKSSLTQKNKHHLEKVG